MALVRSAMGIPSRSGGKAPRSIPRVAGCNRAPKTPWTTRNPITQPTPGANPIPAEAAPNPNTPQANTRWCPNRSPRRPANTNSPATAIRYPVLVHCASVREASRSRRRVG